jgi:D-arabinose 1-dehydrogenase-like Zn-dependent alcohol dehydrogenase
VRAFQLVAWQSPPELRDVPVPEPGQILVKVGGADACHSDDVLAYIDQKLRMERPRDGRPDAVSA